MNLPELYRDEMKELDQMVGLRKMLHTLYQLSHQVQSTDKSKIIQEASTRLSQTLQSSETSHPGRTNTHGIFDKHVNEILTYIQNIPYRERLLQYAEKDSTLKLETLIKEAQEKGPMGLLHKLHHAFSMYNFGLLHNQLNRAYSNDISNIQDQYRKHYGSLMIETHIVSCPADDLTQFLKNRSQQGGRSLDEKDPLTKDGTSNTAGSEKYYSILAPFFHPHSLETKRDTSNQAPENMRLMTGQEFIVYRSLYMQFFSYELFVPFDQTKGFQFLLQGGLVARFKNSREVVIQKEGKDSISSLPLYIIKNR